jgi:hypothetical protein
MRVGKEQAGRRTTNIPFSPTFPTMDHDNFLTVASAIAVCNWDSVICGPANEQMLAAVTLPMRWKWRRMK